ncbi:MBG domain-containing protein [Rhizobium sp. No.120]
MTPQTNRRTFSNGVLSHGTRTRKVRLLALLASTALAHATVAPAQSLPSGGQVAAGSATIGTPSAGALTINQTSGSAVVNWQSFNVGKANRVTFVQPDANAAILNRVTGDTSSTISGQINANGQVYLINPNGIAITSSGTVKAGAFVASTLGISDDDFMGGKRTFTGNGASAPVTNAGAITINRGGYMALIGGTVANAGVITVPMGKAALGSGEQATLDLSGDGFLQVAVPTKADGSGALVDNSGKISARGGTVQLTAAAAKDMARQAVNMSGTIEANGVSGESGDITLTGGDGEVAVSGTLDAGNAAGKGGKVTVTGRSIKLASAKVNASGKTGGGTVNIGGNRQGKGPLQHAETLDVDAQTVINADAVTTGNGGDVVLWSDDLTNFAGTITAKGGAISGNGGEAEVSGKAKLSYTGLTDLTAAHGSFGNLLLDPYNVTISTATDSNTDGGFNATGNDSVINVNTLTNALATANVTVTTGSSSDATNPQAGTITVAAPINWSALTTLTLAAASDININSAITANGGLIVSSGGTISAPAAVNVGAFVLASGNWVQNSATLPAFSAKDFRITDGTSFLRVTGGDGTSATPYTVADVYGLQGIGSRGANLAANWILANDIDASGTAIWNDGAGFVPIGDDYTQFRGTFDGNGHTISGLTVSLAESQSDNSHYPGSPTLAGLFGYILGGSISNVGLVGGSISGGCAGALACASGSTIINAYAIGVTVRGGSVSGANFYAGGLVGINEGTITNSYATGSVSGVNSFVGGLVGSNRSRGSITNSYASGPVSGPGSLGGLTGDNYGTVTTSFWDMDTTGQSSACGSCGGIVSATGLTTAQARDSSNYAGLDFANTWYQAGDMRPILRSEAAANGVITNLHQLALIGANLNGNYTLANNIDASETSGANASGIWSTNGWVPLGDMMNAAFNGNFNGNNHTISALTVSGNDFVGLFGVSRGLISNVGLVGGSVRGVNLYVGALVGYNSGSISNSYSTATVSGGGLVGGLVGRNNSGSISNSYASGAVSGSQEVGGLVGENYSGRISNSYASGAVSGGFQVVGGLVGYDQGGTISNAYATGLVGGSSNVGGLVGATNSGSNFTNSFWDIDTTGQPSGYGSNLGTFSATGLTTAQMADPFSFIDAGWDLANVWGKSTSGANGGYMMLRSLSSGLYDDYVKIGNGTRSYGDANSAITGATLSGAGTGNVSLAWGSAITGTTNAGTYNYSDPDIVSVTENGPRTAYIDYSGTLTISQRVLSMTGSRTYDGTTNVAATGLSLGNLVNGDTLTLTGAGSLADKNAGTGKVLSLGTLALGNSINGDGGLASNYTLIGGTDTVDITRATISDITGITAINRTYDGTTNAALNTSGAGFTGMIAGDSLTVSGGTGAFADKNVGTGKTVSISSLLLGGTDAGNYTLTSNTATATANITKATISAITGITAGNKTYDGTTNVALNTAGAGFTGMVAGDALTVATSNGAFANKNAGIGRTVNISGLTLGGTDVGNYTLASDTATTTADIAKATISAITGITANNKTYNGNTTAVLNTSGAGFTGMIAGDSLTVSGGTGAFADKNVGTGKTVSISSLLLGGTDAGNYTLTSDTATATANITKATISAITGITAGNKTYDGTTNAALNTAGAVFNGMIAGDSLTVSGGTGAFADKNAGTGKTVSISSLSLGGTDAGNYTLTSDTVTATANITKATISAITGITAGNKTYDGTTNVALNTAGAGFTGMVAGDALTVATSSGAFANKNAGTGRTVNISGLTLGGTDVGNYTLASDTATTTADIGQRVVNLSGSRTYNGSTDLDASIFTLSNVVGGETLTLSGTGTMSDKNAGSGKGMTLASLALGDGTNGGLASNYTLAGGTDTVDIARAMISSIGGITANGKTYDGTTDATLNTAGAVFNGMVSGDTLTLGNGFSGAFSDKNAGTGKTVTISGLSFGGADAGNYLLASNTATTLADIAKRAITVTADSAHRTYGDANPGFTYTAGGSGLVAGDTLSGALATSATTASGIGNYGITLGTLANPNYDISFTGANLTVTPRAITVTADAKSKTYGDANPALTYTTSGLVNNDTLSGSLVTSAGQYSGVGGYAITLGSLGNANYAITYNAANLTVTPRAMTVTADAKSKTYGDANPALTYTTSGLVNGDMLSGSLSTSAGQYSNVGSYGITLGSLGNANYAITYNAANLTVTPRAITVTADAKSKTYGDANPALTYTTSGLVNGDMLSGSLSTAAGQYSNVGGYGITLGGLGNANYAITYNAANLTVTPRALTVTADALSRAYGDANPTLTYTTSGLVNNDTLAGSLSTSAGQYSDVGAYAIAQGTLANANYAISYMGANLTVTPRALTVTADALSKIYGDANPMLTYTATGLVNGDTLSGSLATTAAQYANVGSYAITGSFSASSNYALTYVGANLSVNRRALTVTADTLSKTYGDANPALTYTVGGAGLINGDMLSGSLSTTAGQYSNVGSYAITGSFSASSNYALTYVGANLNVNRRALTVTAGAKSKTYGDANPTLTYAATGLLNGDTLSGSLSTTAGQYSDVGAYAITQGSLANTNYAISYMGADLTVNQRAITVAANSFSRRYGLANPALTYIVGGAGLVNGDRLSGGLTTPATRLSEPGAYAITQGTLLASANYRMDFVPGVLTVEKATNPEPGTQASSVMPSFDAGRFAPIPPVSDGTETADGGHDVITDPRFEGTFVCLDNGNGCVSLPGQATP